MQNKYSLLLSRHFRDTSYLVKLLLLFSLYFLTADLGLRMDALSGFASLFWLPTGISLAAILLLGYRVFPAILIGAFFANLAHGAPFPGALGISLGNTLEAVVAAYLLKRIVHFNPSLERLSDVLGLILIGAFFSTMISATIGVSSLFLQGILSTPYFSTWIAWWVGDMLSNLIIAPFLLSWITLQRNRLDWKRSFEFFFLLIIVMLTGIFAFRGLFGIEITNSPLTYLVFPPLIYTALRFGQRETTTAMVLLSLIAVWGTYLGHGPFARATLSESLLFLQSFMIVVSVTSLILSAVVTERRQLEKRKDDFISFASHELKTPLTSIKMFIQVLKRQFAGSKNTQSFIYLHRVDDQVNKLIFLINDMLDVSKIRTNSLELRKEWFSLHDVIEDVIENLQTDERITIKKGRPVPRLYGDKERIRQVLNNLLSNALKYSPQKRKIIVTVSALKKNVSVGVRDYGMGIEAKYHDKIFEQFYRVTDNPSHTLPGLGIGLYLSKSIVKHHGGEMWVKSTYGKGSTFFFSLPL